MKWLILFCSLMIFSVNCFADAIYFKNGKVIEVSEVWEDGDRVKCMQFGGEVSYSKSLIERVEKGLTENQKKMQEEKEKAEKEQEIKSQFGKEEFEKISEMESKLYAEPPVGYEETIKSHLKKTLFDPYSIKELSMGQPTKMVLKQSFHGLKAGQIVFFVHVTYNAKNQYGAYTGLKTHSYFFRQNDIFHIINAD